MTDILMQQQQGTDVTDSFGGRRHLPDLSATSPTPTPTMTPTPTPSPTPASADAVNATSASTTTTTIRRHPGDGSGDFISGTREPTGRARHNSLLQRIRRRLSRGMSGHSSDNENSQYTGYTNITTKISNGSAAIHQSDSNDAVDADVTAGVGDVLNSSNITTVTTTADSDAAAGGSSTDAVDNNSDAVQRRRRKSSGRKVADVLFRRRFYTSGQADLPSSGQQKNSVKQQAQQQHLLTLQAQAAALGSQSSVARALLLQRAHSDTNLAPALTCIVCEKNPAIDPKSGLRMKSFGSRVCSECFKNYIEQKVAAGEAYHLPPPPPPASATTPQTAADVVNLSTNLKNSDKMMLVDVEEIERYCEPEILDRYLLLNTLKRAERYPQYVSCCTPGCGNRMACGDAVLLQQQNSTTTAAPAQRKYFVHCLKCAAEYCPKCKIPKSIHTLAADCGTARAVLERYLNTASIKTKFCSKCGQLNEKTTTACIVCPKCNYKYCWFCNHHLENDEYLLHFTQGPCSGRLGSKQPDITQHHLGSTFMLAGVGLVMLASTPLLLVGMPVYVAARKGHKAWKKRQLSRRAESVTEDELPQHEHDNEASHEQHHEQHENRDQQPLLAAAENNDIVNAVDKSIIVNTATSVNEPPRSRSALASGGGGSVVERIREEELETEAAAAPLI